MKDQDKPQSEMISYIHTSCRECIFAKYEGNTQVDCALKKIDDYRNAGIDVKEVYDNDLEFYVIDGRYCLFYRNEEIMSRYPRNSWEQIVLLQVKVPYQAIIFVEEQNTFADVKSTARSLKEQEVPPNMVVLVNKQYPLYFKEPNKYIKPSNLLNLLSNEEFHKYSLKNVYDEDLNDRSLIDLVLDNTKSLPLPFYAVFKAGFEVPQKFSKELNDAILIKMLQLGFVKPVDDLNGMIVNRMAHYKHTGNSFDTNLEDKILQYEDNGENFIFNISQVCPCLIK